MNHDNHPDESKRGFNKFIKLPDDGDPWAPNNLLKHGAKEKHQYLIINFVFFSQPGFWRGLIFILIAQFTDHCLLVHLCKSYTAVYLFLPCFRF